MDMTPFNICALISVPFFVAAAVFFVKDVRNRQAAAADGRSDAVTSDFSNYFALYFTLFGLGLTLGFFGFGLSIIRAMV